MNALKGILAQLRVFGIARVAMIGGVALGMLAAFVWLEMQGPLPGRMKLVASNLDSATAEQITEELDRRKIPYRLDHNGSELLVAEGQVAAARSILSAKGISADGAKGYEIFDQGSSLTLTDFDEQVRLTRALEGELERTLEQVRGISRARVQLVLPRREPFSRHQQDAQASVMLTFPGQQTLSPEAIQSVVNLVAAAVPSLKPQNITVVDSNLHLLAQAGNPSDPSLQSAKADQERQRLERRLSQGVELMLERSLGVGHVRAEASVTMNFDTTNETRESFDPDSAVIRSTQNVTSNNKTTDKNSNVSLQNNLPNADAGNQTTGSQDNKQEETTNYEISKTVREVVHSQPRIERISLAVMVDGIDQVGPDGKHSWKPRDQAELDRIDKLVKTAIGYDEKRGDHVEVVSMPFINDTEATDTTPATRTAVRNPDLVTFLQVVGFGVVGFGIIILTARSIFNALNKPPSVVVAEEAGRLAPPSVLNLAGGGAGGIAPLGIAQEAGGGALGPLSGLAPSGMAASGMAASGMAASGIVPSGMVSAGGVLPNGGGSGAMETVSMKRIEGQMRLASIRKVTELAESQPENTLAIIRRWMAVEQP